MAVTDASNLFFKTIDPLIPPIENAGDEARQAKILIVDDDVNFTQLVKAFLERTGKYEVWVNNEGSDAVERAVEIRPDLILLDIQMPRSNGAYLASLLGSHVHLLDVPIVYITGIVPKDHSTAARDLGGHPFLAKPVGPQELVECVEQNLRRRS